MNRILSLHTLFFASAAVLAFGCSSPEQPDVPDVPDASVPLSISVSTCNGTPVSRSIVSATGTGTDAVDHIGVFLAADDGYSSYADAVISSAVFSLTSTSPDTWTASRAVNLQSKTASLYAWYPVKEKDAANLTTTISGTTRTIPIEVPADQTFDGASSTACSQPDYLYGLDKDKAAGGSPAPAVIKVNNQSTSPTIYLYHALAQVVFTIEYKASRLPDAEYDYVKSISLSGGGFRAGAGTMQLNDGTLAFTEADANNATLKFSATKDPQLPGNTGKPATVAYGLVAPNSANSNAVTVNLVLGKQGDDTSNRTLSATTTTWFSTAWEPGKRYTYHLLLDKNDLSFESVGIGEWTDNTQTPDTPMPPALGTKLTILAEIDGGESSTPATRDVTSPPASNAYDRSTFVTGDKIKVVCSRGDSELASAGYELNNGGKWTATDIGKELGFLPAITCRAEFPVDYDGIVQNQSTPAAFLKSNLMRTREVTVSSAKVSFTGEDALMHRHSRLTLNFTGENTLPAFSQLNVEGTGLRTGGSTSESITLLRPDADEYTWCAVISPRSGTTTINVSVTDENSVTYKATLTLATVEANNNYIFTLKLQNNVLVPVGGEIKPWEPEVRYTGEFDKNE